MPIIINRAKKVTIDTTITEIQTYMATRQEATFDDLRAAVPALAGLADNEVHQAVADSGFEVDLER